ncbi:unnamed protein product [Spirodela intermedia]|uniref:Uncharacterized protein n=1 Tax=Spirodela intermedia TaxID=51605 RepID=A0A7I8KA98_SPIIN|nr:unnamed protein product [Spirodela intermedia]
MGACGSCQAASEAAASTKVIMEDGELKEFVGPARAGLVLGKAAGYFVCNSDDMEFDDYVTAVGADEELRPGQLYFVLPRSMLKRRLQPEELAALAVKASSALVRGGAAGFCERKASGEEYGRRVVPVGGFSVAGTGARTKRRPKNGRPGGRQFCSKLTAIPE